MPRRGKGHKYDITPNLIYRNITNKIRHLMTVTILCEKKMKFIE